PQVVEDTAGVIPTSTLGAEGMFLGIFTAFISAELYRFFVQKNWAIKMPAGVPEAVSRSFSALIPITMTLSVFLIVRIIFSYTPFETVQNFIRSEEHTSELQSRFDLVCRLLLETKTHKDEVETIHYMP